jgi:hypothetical protein
MTDRLDWTLSPAAVPVVSPLRYVVPFVLGGYLSAGLALAVALVPVFVTRPAVLALVVLLALVGGPFSLLYLWPMLSDPDQRPSLDQFGWLATLRRGPGVLAAALGAVAFPFALLAVGYLPPIGPLLLVLFLPVVLVGLFDVEGSIDRATGTLRVNGQTVDTALLAGVSAGRLGPVALVRLRYESGTSRVGKPWVFAVPASVAEEVREALSDGVASTPADAEGGSRDRDPIATVVLAGTGLLCFAVGIVAVATVEPTVRPAVAGVTGLLGGIFLLAAYAVA